MDRVQQAGRRLLRFTLFLLLLTPLAIGFLVARGGPLSLLPIPEGIVVDLGPLPAWNAAALVLLGSIPPAAFAVALFFMYRLAQLYAAGVVFSRQNVRLIRRIGWVLALVDPLKMLVGAATGPVLTTLGLAGGFLSIDLQIGVSAIGLFVVLVGGVMEEGRKLKEYNDLVV